jgi:hypothetical protein
LGVKNARRSISVTRTDTSRLLPPPAVGEGLRGVPAVGARPVAYFIDFSRLSPAATVFRRPRGGASLPSGPLAQAPFSPSNHAQGRSMKQATPPRAGSGESGRACRCAPGAGRLEHPRAWHAQHLGHLPRGQQRLAHAHDADSRSSRFHARPPGRASSGPPRAARLGCILCAPGPPGVRGGWPGPRNARALGRS